MDLIDVTIEELLNHSRRKVLRYNNDIALINSDDSSVGPFFRPVRINALTIFICRQGELTCKINLKEYTISANSILICFPDHIIQTTKADEAKGSILLVSADYLKDIKSDFNPPIDNMLKIHKNAATTVSQSAIESLDLYYALLRKTIDERNPNILTRIIQALLLYIFSIFGSSTYSLSAENSAASRNRQIFEQFMKLLARHHQQERNIKFYARKMCLTANYISGIIKSYSGRSALAWINEYVVIEAKIMLKYSDMNIQQIADKLNFPTQSSFGKYFKEHTGMSPKHYRKNTIQD